MPVKKVKGGYKIQSSSGKLIGHNKKPFKSKKEAERVARIRHSYKKGK